MVTRPRSSGQAAHEQATPHQAPRPAGAPTPPHHPNPSSRQETTATARPHQTSRTTPEPNLLASTDATGDSETTAPGDAKSSTTGEDPSFSSTANSTHCCTDRRSDSAAALTRSHNSTGNLTLNTWYELISTLYQTHTTLEGPRKPERSSGRSSREEGPDAHCGVGGVGVGRPAW